MHYACVYGHMAVAELLLKQGKADLQKKDIYGVKVIDLIENPGAITAAEAMTHLNIQQRPAKQIKRLLHPEHYPNTSRQGWDMGDGGWGSERLKGFETDMGCEGIDQYWAEEITGEEIFGKYIARNAPIMIRGATDNWDVSLFSFLKFLVMKYQFVICL
jgi:hypothetical protein